MARSWLALALLLAATVSANAERARCWPIDVDLPAADARALPSNTLRWHLGRSGQLLREQPYTTEPLDAVAIGAPDTTPPATPRLTNVSIIDNSGYRDDMDNKQAITLRGTYDAETAVVLVDVTDAHGAVLHLATTPARPVVCSEGYDVAPGRATIAVVAADISGNRSAPFETTVEVRAPRYHHYYRCGLIVVVYFFYGGCLIVALLVIVAIIFTRRARFDAARPEVISVLHAEGVARAVARSYVMKSGVAATVAFALHAREHDILAGGSASLAVIWLWSLVMARYVVRLLETGVTRVERREDWLFVDGRILQASRRIFRVADQLPRACNVTVDRSRCKP